MAEVKRLYFTTIYWQMRKTEIPEQMIWGRDGLKWNSVNPHGQYEKTQFART